MKKMKKSRAQRARNKRMKQQHHIALDFSDQLTGTLSYATKLAGMAAGALTLVSTLSATPASALPQNGSVVGGTATISQPSATTLNVNQASVRAIINWSGFNIAGGEKVNFVQPGSASVALNRVSGSDPTLINGALSGNGQIWVINPNGLLFGSGASVTAGSFLASTMNIGNNDFMSGNYTLKNGPGSTSSIVNQGSIVVADGGYAVLAAPSVTNSGTIVANLGKVHLASGDEMMLSFNAGSLIKLLVSGDVAADALGVNNLGTITAHGGEVTLSARVAADLLKNVVNNQGFIEAQSVSEKNGVIILDGGNSGITVNSGVLDASGKGIGETGGTVKLLGNGVALFAGAKVDVSGDLGGGTVLVGGNFHGSGPEQNAAVTYVDKGASISADAISNGGGGRVAVWADDTTRFYGTISAMGGSQGGNGGFVEVSGKQNLAFSGQVSTLAPHGQTGTLLLDPVDVTILGGAGDGAADGNITFAGAPSAAIGTVTGGDTGPLLIYQSELQGIAATTNINVQATNNILFAGAFGATGLNFNQNAGRSVTLNAGNKLDISSNAISTSGGNIVLTAGAGGVQNIGAITTSGGTVTITTGTGLALTSSITTGNGAISLTSSGTITESGSGILSTTGLLTTSSVGGTTLNSANTVTGCINHEQSLLFWYLFTG